MPTFLKMKSAFEWNRPTQRLPIAAFNRVAPTWQQLGVPAIGISLCGHVVSADYEVHPMDRCHKPNRAISP